MLQTKHISSHTTQLPHTVSPNSYLKGDIIFCLLLILISTSNPLFSHQFLITFPFPISTPNFLSCRRTSVYLFETRIQSLSPLCQFVFSVAQRNTHTQRDPNKLVAN
jgi:hypothetical protein